jgi:vancomycin resistance protein VanJ
MDFALHMRIVARFAGRLSLAASQMLAVVVGAWFVLRLYPGDSWLPVRLGGYFAPWLFIALIPAAVVALVNRRRWLAAFVLVFLIHFAGYYGPLFAPRSPQAQAAQAATAELRVMTFNVNLNNRNAEGIAELVERLAPDLVAFQEMMPALLARLQPRLAASHPYLLVDESWVLPLVLVSRYPLTPLPKPAEATRAQHALVETPMGAVVVWNVHPNPAVRSGWETQRQVLASVAADIATETRPVIVMGDFNATDQSANYRLIANWLTDAHRATGQGFGFTFPDFSRARSLDLPATTRPLLATGPLVRIDHILASRHFTPRQAYVVPLAYGSDHRPVGVVLGWDKGEAVVYK